MATRGAITQSDAPEAWALPLADVTRWFKGARKGDQLIYAHGPDLVQGETATFVRDLALGDRAFIFRRRAEGESWDFLVRKLGRDDPAMPGARPADGDDATEAIYRALRRQANFGQRAATNPELARIAGLATPAQAAWRVTKLVKAGKIRTQVVTTDREANFRIVTIIATGKSTLAPESWERAKAEAMREPVK